MPAVRTGRHLGDEVVDQGRSARLASCNLPISLCPHLSCRIYRETPAGVAASEKDSQEGQEETWELLLDDMPRFRLFMSTAKKSKVPCEYLTTVHTRRGACMLFAIATSVSVPQCVQRVAGR